MRVAITILTVILLLVGLSRVGYCPTYVGDRDWVEDYHTIQWNAYADSIAQRESGGDTLAVGLNYYLGIYQFGRGAARDIGIPYHLLLTKRGSDTALVRYSAKNWEYLKAYRSYVGDTINGIPITKAGMLAAAHLRGHVYAAMFLYTRGDSIGRDANGVGVDEYYRMMSNVHIK